MDVAPHRGLGVLHPALLQQLVDHQQAVVLPEPSLDLLTVPIQRMPAARLAAALFVVHLLQLVFRRQLSLLVQPPLLFGEFLHPANYLPVLAGLALDRPDRLVHPQASDDIQ